ncbi:hypothetical protein KAFR_0F02570 [Kazachstania africana CBS 2517]|uniref:RecA family profile 1 domain-containing protein n=1 Tax=Kazachstania africana (strain ATCC 22294 / BCRC 22015 / CBS 2517 / CECT 1963 / NBRC 1671 / NRRL Y-8276) TaxID=1071382 RepID=H2AWV4_KAZAF|nr:hypothetical protein KAFR_0F02570 [Kazachstania africana CBS 2517]CCF58854.1 hypothetical protein KAFR_0F02570 [Kazachstania africana CBS 2517]
MDLYDELPDSNLLYDVEFSSLLEAARVFQVTVLEFLKLSAQELARTLQRSVVEVSKFQNLLQKDLDEQYGVLNNVNQLRECAIPHPITTGDISIDEALGGGIFTKCITEVFGESSTGKSQFLMQLSLAVQMPKDCGGAEAKCVYITTEGDLPTQRIQDMIESREEFKKSSISQSNIYTVSCNDLVTQEHILNVQLPILLEQSKGAIKLVIIDSISHHMRVELESNSFKESQDNRYYVSRLAEALLKLANKYNLAVVVANQVGDKPFIELTEPQRYLLSDYEYQLGWIVGWKDSTILFRQRAYEELKASSPGIIPSQKKSFLDILSDDEDHMLIEKEVSRVLNGENSSVTRQASKSTSSLSIRNESSSVTDLGKERKYISSKRKRKLDHRVPNLGLSWANYVSTRILLKKSYKAAPVIRRGELRVYGNIDPASFWQVKRIFKIVYSTYCRPEEISYSITKKGIESV